MSEFFHSTLFLIFLAITNVILLILYVLENIKLSKLKANYSTFMSKLGNGSNIDEMLKKYIEEVESINLENKEIERYCEKLDNRVNQCIQKTGLVRYNAYKDTGSDLSFAVALLDDENNGIILNGIYARDSSNIYCKTVEKGKPLYKLSKQEQEALDQALSK